MLSSHSDNSLVSVVVPVHNGGGDFSKCLTSLARWGGAAEVIVVADGESDGSWRLAEQYGAKVIHLPESKGPARARNLGAKAALGDLILFIDADVQICPETVSRISAAFRQDESLTALIGSYDDAPGAANFLSQYKNLFHHYTHQQGNEEASTFWGACGAIRKDVFLAMGGFDERYRRPCIEDIELGYRLKQAGYKIRLYKDVQVKHLKHWTPFSLLRAEIFYRALPWMALLLHIRQTNPNQYAQFSSDLNLRWSSRLSVLLIYGIVLAASLIFISLVAGWPWHIAGVSAMVMSLVLLAINAPVYRFFYRKRGFLFTLRVLPWHWLYYFYSGLAFVIGVLRHRIQGYSLAA